MTLGWEDIRAEVLRPAEIHVRAQVFVVCVGQGHAAVQVDRWASRRVAAAEHQHTGDDEPGAGGPDIEASGVPQPAEKEWRGAQWRD